MKRNSSIRRRQQQQQQQQQRQQQRAAARPVPQVQVMRYFDYSIQHVCIRWHVQQRRQVRYC